MGGAERSLWTAWTRKGQGKAFEALVRPHMRAAYEAARRRGCSHHDAEDCVQRALFQLVREREGGVPPVGVRAWLGRAVALNVKMLRRSSKRRSARERRVARPAETPPAPDTHLEVEAVLRGLPDTERRALVLRYLHDLDYAEMARALGASPLACRLRVHRALKRLRGRLGASGPAWLVALVALSRPARASPLVPIGGALLMTTTGKLALGGAAVLATAALFVGVTNRSEDADRLPTRAETARTEVAAAERARKTAEAPPSPPDIGAVRESVEEARESASGVEVERLNELYEGVGALAERLRLIEASEGREEAALKPDPITRRYLDELVAASRRLPEGAERAGVLQTFGAAYKRYTEATGDRSLDVFLVEVLDRSAHKDERNAAAEALFGGQTPAPRLLELMESPHTEVRWRVASRLAWVRGDDRPRAIERLYPALNDKDPIVRWNAALGLGTAAPDARTFEAVLNRLAREEDRRVAYPLARAALKIDREAGRSRLRRMLPALPSDETREMVSKAIQRAE